MKDDYCRISTPWTTWGSSSFSVGFYRIGGINSPISWIIIYSAGFCKCTTGRRDWSNTSRYFLTDESSLICSPLFFCCIGWKCWCSRDTHCHSHNIHTDCTAWSQTSLVSAMYCHWRPQSVYQSWLQHQSQSFRTSGMLIRSLDLAPTQSDLV